MRTCLSSWCVRLRALNERSIATKGANVLVLGMAYTPDVDDLRKSPSLAMIELLQGAGCDVSYNDPFFPKVGHGCNYALNVESTPLERVGEFDCVLVATNHSDTTWKSIVSAAKLVVDSRNVTRHIQSPNIVRC